VVGVIPSAKRCARDAGFRFAQPLNYPHLLASKDCPAIDGYSSAPCGPPHACELHTLSEDKWDAARSSGTKMPSSLARAARRNARRRLVHGAAGCSMRAARVPIEAATGLSERGLSAAIET